LKALSPWNLAGIAAAVLAVSPAGMGGLRLRAPAGPVRDRWLEELRALLPQGMKVRRMPATIGDSRLLGGLDLAATLSAGCPVAEPGLLAEAHEGLILISMAERLPGGTAALLAAVMDQGEVAAERDGLTIRAPAEFGVVALDEGLDDEVPPATLLDRLGLSVDLREISHRDPTSFVTSPGDVAQARARLTQVTMGDEVVSALCAAALGLGIASLRAPLQALHVAGVLAALAGRDVVSDADAALAAMLVLAPRATQLPAAAGDEEQAADEQTTQDEAQHQDQPPQEEQGSAPEAPTETPAMGKMSDDIVLEAALAAIPAGLLARIKAAGGPLKVRAPGRAGAYQKATTRGRVVGFKTGDLRSGARLDVVETLRAAAPWQGLRQRRGPAWNGNAHQPIAVRRDDFRIARYRQRTETATIFVVDASGSSALQRLAEAKGAIRLLLAECYIRRDEVALIAFRGTTAEVLLPPTRALVRAQRALADLPGGGGTPIAMGIDAAAQLADTVRRNGRSPAIVMMTDGRANIGRDGKPGRIAAQEDARIAARHLRTRGLPVILIDTSPKPQALAAELAMEMGARYVPLPHADAARVARTVNALLPAQGPGENRGAA
jgi:magnesium chelatase subunit D